MKVIHRILLLLIITPAVFGQEFLALTDDEISRLTIVFAPVSMMDLQSGNQFPATVVTSPDSISKLMIPYGGVVERWHSAPGEQLEAGTVLASIRSQEILDIQSQWLLARSELQQAITSNQRNEILHQQGIISEQRLQQGRRELEQDQLTVDSARGKLALAGFDSQDLQNLEQQGESSGVYLLRAPIAGTLSHRSVVAGDYIPAFSEAASLQNGNQPWLKVELPARLGQNLLPGHALSLVGSGESLTLRQKDLLIDETTQTVEILAQFNSAVSYLPGQVLSVIISPRDSGVLVPSDAVAHNAEETVVYVQADGGVDARSLQLQAVGADYLAQSGLAVGERVVIQGAAILKGIQLGLGRGE